MRSVVDRNVIIRRIPVLLISQLTTVPLNVTPCGTQSYHCVLEPYEGSRDRWIQIHFHFGGRECGLVFEGGEKLALPLLDNPVVLLVQGVVQARPLRAARCQAANNYEPWICLGIVRAKCHKLSGRQRQCTGTNGTMTFIDQSSVRERTNVGVCGSSLQEQKLP